MQVGQKDILGLVLVGEIGEEGAIDMDCVVGGSVNIDFSGVTCGVVQLLLLADVFWLQAAMVGVSKVLEVADDEYESLAFSPALELALGSTDET